MLKGRYHDLLPKKESAVYYITKFVTKMRFLLPIASAKTSINK